MDQQAVHRLRFGREVVVVKRKEANLLQLGHSDRNAFPLRREESVQCQQQQQIDWQDKQHARLGLRAVSRQPFFAEKAVRRQSQRHSRAAREDGNTLTDAGREESL